MTLATHILTAGAITKPFLGRVNSFVIFIIAILSHYLSDAIPHFDYKLLSVDWRQKDNPTKIIDKRNARIIPDAQIIITDLLNVAIDVAIGATLLILLARPEINFTNFINYSLIVIGGILPDALQPIYILWKKFPMDIIQTLHDFWHAKLRLELNKTAVISQGLLFITAALLNYHF